MPDRNNRSDLPIHPVLNERYSPRSFKDRDVTDPELELVLEAARWAPSSMNEQPWRFLVARKGGVGHAELLATLAPSNALWADKAPILILTMVHRTFKRNGLPNIHAWHDLGGAVAMLTVQATALGMGIHQLGGFSATTARAHFQVPEDLDVVSVLALGHPGHSDALPEGLREREERRSPRSGLADLVRFGK